MKRRPCSNGDHGRGVFVSIDGPSGAGKSTIVQHLAQLLVAAGHDVHVTAEPSNGPIGQLCHELTETVTGHALACLYTADRYYHVETEILPLIEAGKIIISDRYIPSGLVMQRFDGVDLEFLWQLNAQARHRNVTTHCSHPSQPFKHSLQRFDGRRTMGMTPVGDRVALADRTTVTRRSACLSARLASRLSF